MNLKIIPVGQGAVQVLIEKEDYSIADIVHKELMNVKHVKFAGVAPPHPLIKTLTIEVSTDSNKPTKALEEALKLSQERVAELLKVAKEIFPQAPTINDESHSKVDSVSEERYESDESSPSTNEQSS
ncbi:MAG TPA: RpoL/Rpb11 RNA polymerase subunit family protein [Nitrososphaerales archaeon]|nr:RpoL/Rpb11 RNA polymerase subunit family protein [Nitrososphaerales archaeon]